MKTCAHGKMFSRRNIASACFVAGISILATYWIQPTLLYFARSYDTSEVDLARNFASKRGFILRKIEYTTNSHGPQSAFVMSRKDSSPKRSITLFILLGGNAMTALDWTDWVTDVALYISAEKTPVFLMIDYPGYGLNGGSPSPDGMQTNVEEAVAATLDDLDVVAEINVLGHSIGAAVASRWVSSLTKDKPVNKLILSAPFTSVVEMTPVVFPIIPPVIVPLLTRHNWNNKESVAAIVNKGLAREMFIVHGDRDELVPFRMGEDLAGISPEDIQFIPIKNAGHNDLLSNLEVFAMILAGKYVHLHLAH